MNKNLIKPADAPGSFIPQRALADHSDVVVQSVKICVGSITTLHASRETKTRINYQQLVIEHAELIKQGKNSLEIAQWIGDKLNIPSWRVGAFFGERKVLSSPQTRAETLRLKKFIEALGEDYTKANGPSRNHPQYLLLNGSVQKALFGEANMAQVDVRLETFHTDWQAMGNDFIAKAHYLLEKIGLDIKGNWKKLTGIRFTYGNFYESNNLCASGMLDEQGNEVTILWVNQTISGTGYRKFSGGRLCFLS